MTSNQTHTAALEALHQVYVEAINSAVAEDRMDLVAALSAEYDRQALSLLAEQVAPAA